MAFDGCFVTGTDTGVGKTLVSAALLHTLARHHRRAVGMKPVAAGLVAHGGGWASEDVLALRAASNIRVPAELDNPVALPDAMAPHIAARRAGQRLSVAELLAAYRALQALTDVVVVEGAGGWRVPISDTETLADLARAIGLPVVLVVGVRLGCLNHALLTAEAVRTDGLVLAGWVANEVEPAMDGALDNIEALRERLAAPLLGHAHRQTTPPDARHISLQLPPAWR